MYSYEQKKRAIEVYNQYGENYKAMFRELGYPCRTAFKRWLLELRQEGDVRRRYKASKVYTEEQKATAKKIKPTAKKITGTGYAGSIIKIYKGKKLIGKATCTKKGKYTVKVKKPKLLKKGAGIRIVSTAKAKGKLFKSEAVVKVK